MSMEAEGKWRVAADWGRGWEVVLSYEYGHTEAARATFESDSTFDAYATRRLALIAPDGHVIATRKRSPFSDWQGWLTNLTALIVFGSLLAAVVGLALLLIGIL